MCLFVPHDISKPMQLGSKLDVNMVQRVLETHLFQGQRVKGPGHEAQKNIDALVSAGFLQLYTLCFFVSTLE